MELQIKALSNTASIPTRGSDQAAGYDLYCSNRTANILSGDTAMVKTDIAMAIPDGYVGLVFARSGLATKQGLRPANCVGVIDSDYRGEVIVALYNDSPACQSIDQGDRIAQICFVPYLAVDMKVVDELTDTDRGVGGFGSTGK